MDARLNRLAAFISALVLLGAVSAQGATYRTANFVVTAPTPDLAQQVAETAERCRAELARDWLGHELPRWFNPCKVHVNVGQIGAGGATTFTFAAGQVFGWNMNVQGTAERILDSVIPHEVSHTIFASHFRRPLPRWADEGAASLVEHESERNRQLMMLRQVFNTTRRIPLTRLISMKEYPSDMHGVLTLYAEGYSLADYLVQSGGKQRYLGFLKDAHEHDWNHAIRTFYGLPNVTSLEERWSNWVLAGSPDLAVPNDRLVAEAGTAARAKGVVLRSQSPDDAATAGHRNRTAQAAVPAKQFPHDNDLQAPEPINRAVQTARTAEPATEGFTSAQKAALRRDGRQRMVNDGWQPAVGAPKVLESQAVREANSNGDSVASDDTSARRRLQQAKLRRDVEAPADGVAPGAAGGSEKVDPFDENRAAESDRSTIEAPSPFHTEN